MNFQRNALLAGAIGLALAAGFAPLDAAAKEKDQKSQQAHGDKDKHADHGKKSDKSDKGKSDHKQSEHRQASHVEHRDAPKHETHRAPAPEYHRDHRDDSHRDDGRRDAYVPAHATPRAPEVRRDDEAHARNAQRAAQRAEDRRISSIERQRMISLQRSRDAEYRRHIEAMRAAESRRIAAINAQRRAQQARYQQWYWQQQQAMAARWTPRDYDRDPYFYTAPSYRYVRDGRAYEINRYAADVLRQAVRYGYEMGARAGYADRQDRWQNDWRNNYAYQDANYGYNGYYVDQADYNYYFRQGFQRGYGDAYGNDWQYGTRQGNDTASILASVLQSILNLQSYN